MIFYEEIKIKSLFFTNDNEKKSNVKNSYNPTQPNLNQSNKAWVFKFL